MRIPGKLNYSNITSTMALVVAVSGVGGVAYAAGLANNSVGSPQIKDGQVKAVDLGKDSVRSAKVLDGTLGQVDLNKAARTAFTAGPATHWNELDFHNLNSGDPDKTIFEFTVPHGNYLVSASGNITNSGNDVNDFSCEIVQPIGDQFTRTIATSEVRVAPGGDLGTISLDGLATKTGGEVTLTMTCQGEQAPYAGKLVDPRIVAVKVGNAFEK